MTTKNDYLKSNLREKLLLHILLVDIYKICWSDPKYDDVQILFPEIDVNGADMAIAYNKITTFIQLKSINKSSTTKQFPVNKRLFENESYCVLLIELNEEDLSANYYVWKNKPFDKFKQAKHAKANSKGVKKIRENIVELPKDNFEFITVKNDLLTYILKP